MFTHFLREYKYEVYKGNVSAFKMVPWYEWASFLVTVALLIFYIKFSIKEDIKKMIIFLLLSLLSIGVLMFFDNHRIKKQKDILLKRYKEKYLQPLCNLLKNEKFDLYSPSKIEWLISCCDAYLDMSKVSFGFSDYFLKYIFPFITLFFGVMITEDSFTNIIVITGIIVGTFLCIFLLKNLLKPLADCIFYPDKEIVTFLKSDLEYIKCKL